MRYPFSILLVLAVAGHSLAVADETRKQPLRLLYIGNKDTDRGRSYAKFLGEHFVLAGAAARTTFDPGSIPAVNVVVLDWSQSDIDHSKYSGRNPSGWESDLKSPLGERGRWTKPTILLGSRALTCRSLEGIRRERVNVPGASRVRVTRPPDLPIADCHRPRQDDPPAVAR